VTPVAAGATLRRLLLVPVIVACAGLALSACGTSGTGLAQQACDHVNRSISLLGKADRQPDAVKSAELRQQAYLQLRDALPIASEAAYKDGQYQALMTTVAESSRVSESALETSLEAQCQAADSSNFGQPAPPSSIPPPAPVNSSP
jgi:hypothetical protein